MRGNLRIFGPLAALVAALTLGACVGPLDEPATSFTREGLEAEALPECTPDDLAAVDEFAPVLDAANEWVGMLMGEPLCRCESVTVDLEGRLVEPRMTKPSGQAPPNDPPLTIGNFIDGTGLVQDPTPQPARPGQPDSSSLAPAPPVPVTNSDKN